MLGYRMKFKVTLLVLSVAFSLAASGAPPQTSRKPLGERQLQGLVNGGVDSHRLALLVANRGIDFKPSQQFLESLQKAGAEDVLIQAIRRAERRNQSEVTSAARSARTPAPEKIEGPPLAAAPADGAGPVRSDGIVKQAIGSAPPTQAEAGERAAITTAEAAAPAGTQAVLGQALARAAEFEQGQSWSEAEGAYRAALKLEPANASAHLGLARALDQEKKWDEAIAEYREAARLNPADLQAHLGLGLTLVEKQDWNGAVAAYRQALRRSSNDPELYKKLGEALYGKGDLSSSVDAFRTAASLKPADARVRNSLGLALCGLGDVDGALAAYREAVTLDPKYAEAYNNLGDALLKKGDRRGALEAYHQAFELAPDNSTLGASYQAILKQLNP